MNSVYNAYIALLYITDESLMHIVDLYNAGTLDNETFKQALEIIDGLPIDD